MIKEMAKVQLIGTRATPPEMLELLYKYGKLHIEKVTYPTLEVQSRDKSSFLLRGMSLTSEEAKELSELQGLSRLINSLISYLGKVSGVVQENPAAEGSGNKELVEQGNLLAKKDTARFKALIDEVEGQKDAIHEDLLRAEGMSGHIARFGKILEIFAQLIGQYHDLNKIEIVGFTVEKNKKVVVDLIKDKLNQLVLGEYKLFIANMDRGTATAIVVCSPDNAGKIRDMFNNEGVPELALPEEFANTSLKDTISLLYEKKSSLAQTKEQIQDRLRELGNKSLGHLRKLKTEIDDRLAYFEEIPKFAETKFTFVMLGWLPKDELPAFKELIKQTYKKTVVMEELPIEEADKKHIPVTLENHPLIRPFETIIKVFKPPVYGSIDPTWVLATFFPVIFGLILGDVGYGLLLLLPALWIWLNKKFAQPLRDVGYIFTLCGISSVVFGVLFGEFMGNLGHCLGLSCILSNREKDLIKMIAMTVGFGFMHILLSLTIKGVQSYKAHNHINKHVVEAVSTILVLCSLLILILTAANVLPKQFMTPGLVALGVSFVGVVASGGMIGGLEIMGTIGNVLSYARIMAIGLSSVILALVANNLFSKIPLVAGFLVAFILHLINYALGIFGPTIHGLRLHFVEAFQKFAKFEGRVYQPFRRGGEL